MTPDQRAAQRDRSRAFWEQRRARGLCCAPHCRNTPATNPKTGLPYWRCVAHRGGAHGHGRKEVPCNRVGG